MSSNLTDYDKIAIKCVRESLALDKGNGNLNQFKSELQNLMILKQLPEFQSNYNEDLLQLINQLYEITTQKTQKTQTNNLVLLFFYKNNCEPSSKFVEEWKKIKNITNSKYKMLSVNCEDIKHKELCKKMNIFEYPTVKYIKNGKIIDYFGNLTADEIIKTFKL